MKKKINKRKLKNKKKTPSKSIIEKCGTHISCSAQSCSGILLDQDLVISLFSEKLYLAQFALDPPCHT